MQARLTKIKGGKALRTQQVEGRLLGMMLGKSLNMFSEPLDPEMDGRWVSTSPILEATFLADGAGIIITTYTGSEYLVEKI